VQTHQSKGSASLITFYYHLMQLKIAKSLLPFVARALALSLLFRTSVFCVICIFVTYNVCQINFCWKSTFTESLEFRAYFCDILNLHTGRPTTNVRERLGDIG